jgi:hypothetical protein
MSYISACRLLGLYAHPGEAHLAFGIRDRLHGGLFKSAMDPQDSEYLTSDCLGEWRRNGITDL